MSRKQMTIVACAALLSVVTLGLAVAQTDDGKPSTLAMEVESLEVEVANLSGEEKLERSVEKIDTMKEVLSDTTALVEKVRKEEKDILKLNCVNEKQAAIRGFVKVGEQSYAKLKEAVNTDDEKSENHHYTLISIAGQKTNNLGEEAKVCAGEVLRFAGDTVVETEIDPDIAENNPTEDIDDEVYEDFGVSEQFPVLTAFR